MINKRKLASLPNANDRGDYGAVGDAMQPSIGQQYGSLNSGYRPDLQSGGSNQYGKINNSKAYPSHLVGSVGLPKNANSLPSQYQR